MTSSLKELLVLWFAFELRLEQQLSRNRLLRSNFCQNQLVLRSSIYIEVRVRFSTQNQGFQ